MQKFLWTDEAHPHLPWITVVWDVLHHVLLVLQIDKRCTCTFKQIERIFLHCLLYLTRELSNEVFYSILQFRWHKLHLQDLCVWWSLLCVPSAISYNQIMVNTVEYIEILHRIWICVRLPLQCRGPQTRGGGKMCCVINIKNKHVSAWNSGLL